MSNYWQVLKKTLIAMIGRPMWLMLLLSVSLTSLPYIYRTMNDLPVAVVDMDKTPASRLLVRMLDAAPKIAVRTYDNLPDAQEDMAWQRLFGIIIFPQDMEKKLLRGDAVTIPVFGDASNRMANGQIQQDIGNVYNQLLNMYNTTLLGKSGFGPEQAQVVISPVVAHLEDIYNPGISFAAIVLPGLVTLILQHGLLLSCTRVNLMLRGGTPRSLRQPVSTRFGRYTAQMLIWLVLAMLLYVIWPNLFGFRQTASFWALLGLVIPFLVAVIALSEFVAELLPSEEAVYLVLTFITLPLFYLGGYIWPPQAMPGWIILLADCIPSTWAIRAVAEMNQMNLPLSAVSRNVVILFIMAACYGVLGTLIYQYRNWKQDEKEKIPRYFLKMRRNITLAALGESTPPPADDHRESH